MDEEIRTELKNHAEKLTDHAEKLASLLGLKEQITLVSTALNSQCTTLTTMTTQLAVLVAELPHIAEREDSKIQKHFLDCTIKQERKDNPGGFANSNTFSAFGGLKLPRNAPRWLMWLVFGTVMALVGKLSEAIELFRITQ